MPRTADELPARTRRRSARARPPALSGIQTRHEPARPVRQEGTRVNDTTSGADLAAKKLPELQAMAAERGWKHDSPERNPRQKFGEPNAA